MGSPGLGQLPPGPARALVRACGTEEGWDVAQWHLGDP
jgi:hypothetical protein